MWAKHIWGSGARNQFGRQKQTPTTVRDWERITENHAQPIGDRAAHSATIPLPHMTLWIFDCQIHQKIEHFHLHLQTLHPTHDKQHSMRTKKTQYHLIDLTDGVECWMLIVKCILRVEFHLDVWTQFLLLQYKFCWYNSCCGFCGYVVFSEDWTFLEISKFQLPIKFRSWTSGRVFFFFFLP